jgi:hypothetical protein
VLEDATSGFCGAVLRWERGLVILEDRHGNRRTFALGAGFWYEGSPVVLKAPPRARSVPTRTASGSIVGPGPGALLERSGTPVAYRGRAADRLCHRRSSLRGGQLSPASRAPRRRPAAGDEVAHCPGASSIGTSPDRLCAGKGSRCGQSGGAATSARRPGGCGRAGCSAFGAGTRNRTSSRGLPRHELARQRASHSRKARAIQPCQERHPEFVRTSNDIDVVVGVDGVSTVGAEANAAGPDRRLPHTRSAMSACRRSRTMS